MIWEIPGCRIEMRIEKFKTISFKSGLSHLLKELMRLQILKKKKIFEQIFRYCSLVFCCVIAPPFIFQFFPSMHTISLFSDLVLLLNMPKLFSLILFKYFSFTLYGSKERHFISIWWCSHGDCYRLSISGSNHFLKKILIVHHIISVVIVVGIKGQSVNILPFVSKNKCIKLAIKTKKKIIVRFNICPNTWNYIFRKIFTIALI